MISLFAFNNAYAKSKEERLNDFDSLRGKMSFMKNKESKEFIKSREQLNKIISQNKINYDHASRLDDVIRLMSEKKYNAAIYELNSLIEEKYMVSKCYEFLGDICYQTKKPFKKTMSYYKKALESGTNNVSLLFKLAKICNADKKNILSIDFLNQAVENTDDYTILSEIEQFIQFKGNPANEFEANSLYETLGNVQLKLGKREEAYKNFTKAIQINQNDIYLKYYLTGLYFDDNYGNEALQLANKIIDENANDVQIKITRAKSLAKIGHLDTAYSEYLQILKQNPDSAQAKYGIYQLYRNHLSMYDVLRKIYTPQNILITKEEVSNFARFLASMNDFQGAKNYNAYVNRINELEARERQRIQEELERQKREKELLIQRQKEEEEARIREEKRKQEELEEKIRREKELEAERIRQEEKRKEEEIRKQQEEIQQQAEAKFNLNNEKDEEIVKEQNKIKDELKKFKEKNPEKYEEYKKSLDKYLAIEPKDSKTHFAIANTYKLMQMPSASLKYYNEAIKLDPTNSDLYYSLGLTHMELGDFETAKTNLKKSINLDKANGKAINLLSFVEQKLVRGYANDAYTKFEKNQYLDALDLLDKSLKDFPNNAQLYYYRALVYDGMNRNAAAIIDLQKAVSLDPSLYMGFYQLGMSYEKIKDGRNALVAYERFLSTEPDEKDLIEEVQKKVIYLGEIYY